ncbi:MAG: TetR/AcrR family transcriptional regulator [Actinomycetota bacterium]
MESGKGGEPPQERALGARASETRDRLLEAAEEVFGRLGFHDASIVEITQKAQVGLGTFYRYFDSKVGAFRDLVRTRRDELRQAAKDAAAAHTTQRDMLRAAFGAFFAGIAEHRGAFRLIREAEFVDRALVLELYEFPAQDFREGVEAAMAAGALPDGDAEMLAWCASGMAEFVALRWIVWGEGGLSDTGLNSFVDAMLRLVGSPETTSS